jgi:hypothetical protein
MDPWQSVTDGINQAFTWIGDFFSHAPTEFIALLVILAILSIVVSIFGGRR